MFINNFDPVAFTFLSLQIKWYSISYILGIVLGWTYCKKKLIEDKKILNLFDDLIAYIILGIIIGGRLGYILIYNLKYYLENISEILSILRSKRDEVVFKMDLATKEETEIINKRIENLEKKIKKLQKNYLKKKSKKVKKF